MVIYRLLYTSMADYATLSPQPEPWLRSVKPTSIITPPSRHYTSHCLNKKTSHWGGIGPTMLGTCFLTSPRFLCSGLGTP